MSELNMDVILARAEELAEQNELLRAEVERERVRHRLTGGLYIPDLGDLIAKAESINQEIKGLFVQAAAYRERAEAEEEGEWDRD